MAAGSAAKDKENAAPPASGATASAVAVSRRRHGYGVKSSCGVKKRRLLSRVPLRDITNLIEAISAVAAPVLAPLGQEVPQAAATELTEPDADAVVRLAGLQDGGDAAGPVVKAARYSLRKGFR